MSRTCVRLALGFAVALLTAAGASLAHASAETAEELARAQLIPTGQPALLGTIDESGRNGWQCFPEQAASAKSAAAAELPASDR